MAPPTPPPPLSQDLAAPQSPSLSLSNPPISSVFSSLEAPASSLLLSSDQVTPSASVVGNKSGLINTPANSSPSPMVMGSPSATGQGSTISDPSLPQHKNFNWTNNLHSAARFPVTEVPVSTSAEGRPRVRVSNGVFERGAKIHSDYIVGIFYGKAPSYGKIWGVLNYLWGKDKRVTIHHLSKNAYLFYIPSPTLRNCILQHELWRVGDSPFFVTKWKSEFSTNPPSLDKAPVWVTLQNLLFDLITPEGLSSVCYPLGRIVDSKPFTSISSAGVKVVVDLTKPLPPEVEVECDDGNVLLIKVIYPWLPPLCSFFNQIGHKTTLCPSAPTPEKKK
uniref:DUF4283 domain-containing protein n=1 Tax=Brassica oleracea TaxID=3712 RepID=A0A3P6B9S0_BRAOL|nr:unnamed protein product [Brassica oleracea]